jgi:hypothetical protein
MVSSKPRQRLQTLTAVGQIKNSQYYYIFNRLRG